MISIAVCTYNNAASLAMTLESLTGLACPPDLAYEILVIDNNSGGETREVFERYRETLGTRLRYVFESRQGLSHARNRAAKEAAGDIVSYIDDDVKVEPGWLAAVAAAFEKYAPAIVGGRSYLIYPSARPAWLPDRGEGLLSRLDYGDEAIVDTDRQLFGLNFSVKKEWLEKAGGFDGVLGRCGRSLRSGEEMDLQKRIRAQGGIAVYEPRAIVGHVVSVERLKKRWLLRRFFAAGRTDMILAMKSGDALPTVFQAVVRAVRCVGSIPKSIVLADFSRRNMVDRLFIAAHALGKLDARFRLARRNRRASTG